MFDSLTISKQRSEPDMYSNTMYSMPSLKIKVYRIDCISNVPSLPKYIDLHTVRAHAWIKQYRFYTQKSK